MPDPQETFFRLFEKIGLPEAGSCIQPRVKTIDLITNRWGGLPISAKPVQPLSECFDWLPRFKKISVSKFGFEENLHRVFVVSHSNPKPVAMVSPGYRIVQHAEMLEAAKDFLAVMNCSANVPARIHLTSNGERMAAWLDLGEKFAYKPDGHTISLQLQITNTVDGGGSMNASLLWFRQVCSNGLKIQKTYRSTIRHGESATPDLVFAPIADQLLKSEVMGRTFEAWSARSVDLSRIRTWIDEDVSEAWGKLAAARLWSIATTGHDAEFSPPFASLQASRRKVKPTIEVPGSPSTSRTLYDVAQAASWIASRRTSFEEAQAMQQQIETLVSRLN